MSDNTSNMSAPVFEVMPVQGDPPQRVEHRTGPLKEILKNQDSLYKYFNWEDPVRSIGSYMGIIGILSGIHFLPLTQMALRIGAMTLGALSIAEYANRSFTSNTVLARLRPKEYKKIPESILDDTLRDIHDLVQYTVVQAQKIVFCQDLGQTFGTAIGLTALYWFVKMVSPFALAILGVTMLYAAPLIGSPQGREVVRDAKQRATELSDAALQSSHALVQDGKTKVAQLSSSAQETAQDAKRRLGDLAQSGSNTVGDVSAQAQETASNISGSAADNVKKLPQVGNDAINQVSDTTNSNLGDAKHRIHSALYGTADSDTPASTDNDNSTSDTSAATKDVNTNLSSEENTNYTLDRTTQSFGNTMASTPRQSKGTAFIPGGNTESEYAPAGALASTHDIMDRSRPVVPAKLDGLP